MMINMYITEFLGMISVRTRKKMRALETRKNQKIAIFAILTTMAYTILCTTCCSENITNTFATFKPLCTRLLCITVWRWLVCLWCSQSCKWSTKWCKPSSSISWKWQFFGFYVSLELSVSFAFVWRSSPKTMFYTY